MRNKLSDTASTLIHLGLLTAKNTIAVIDRQLGFGVLYLAWMSYWSGIAVVFLRIADLAAICGMVYLYPDV